ncbi:MAG: DUF4097 family beta strand repeat-containing protein [Candidatus Izemoplasmatales bacterium]|jgi:hypothetical protein|nr:DUF4097 family beta strand repeat-containing protein [Candidatus Izemoplasmatales bacterium]MDD3865356.1 DUF4097 family beta strand repeat-containing protein [Candidatus Izemoplasmatales bacterium]
MVKILKAGIIFILLGIGACVAGFLTTNDQVGNEFPDHTYTLVEGSYEIAEISAINMDFDNRKVIVGQSTTDKIEVSYYVSENDPIEVLSETKSLTFDSDLIWYWNFFWGLSWLNWSSTQYYDFYLYLPEGTDFDLNIDTSNGAITVEAIDNLGDLDLNTLNGKVTLSNIDAKSIRVTTANGIINVNNADCGTEGNIYLKTSNGSIDVTAITMADLSCYTSNGAIDVTLVGEFTDYATNFATANGSIYVDGNITTAGTYHAGNANQIILHTSNGSIHLDFLP